MTLVKGKNGTWEGDFRYKGFARLHLSMRTTKKAEAKLRHDAVVRLYREAKGPAADAPRALIRQLHSGDFAVERLETMVRTGTTLAPDSPVSAADWKSVEETGDRYLEWLDTNENKSYATWHTARAQLRKAFAFEWNGIKLGDLPLDRVPSAMIEAYQAKLITDGHPPNTVTAYLTRVAAVWNWQQRRENRLAVEERRAPRVLPCPIDPETAARGSSSRDRWLTREEAERVVAATPDNLLVVVGLGLFAGLRIGEALHLRPSDIDLTLGTLSIQKQPEWKPKTKRAIRVVPIADPLRALIIAQLDERASAGWLIPSIRDTAVPFEYHSFDNAFRAAVLRAELISGRKDPRGVVFHTLRHTFASWLVMKAIDLYTVAQLLGDTIQTVEKVYAHLSPDVKRRAIAALNDAITMPEAA